VTGQERGSGEDMHKAEVVSAEDWSAKLWLVGCCAFIGMASMRICDAMLPALAQEFGTTTGRAAQAISAFALAYGLLQLFYGPLGDRYGKVKVIGLATLDLVARQGDTHPVLALFLGELEMVHRRRRVDYDCEVERRSAGFDAGHRWLDVEKGELRLFKICLGGYVWVAEGYPHVQAAAHRQVLLKC